MVRKLVIPHKGKRRKHKRDTPKFGRHRYNRRKIQAEKVQTHSKEALEFLSAKRALLTFVMSRNEFTLQELSKHVKNQAKTTRIGPGRDIRDWITSARERGELIEISPQKYRWKF